MVLTVHIDNRSIGLRLFSKERPLTRASVATDPDATADQLAVTLGAVLRLHSVPAEEVEGVIISSVVPSASAPAKKAFGLLFGKEALMVGAGIKTGLNIRLDNIASVGSDFICNAVGALLEFRPPLVIMNMAGATTFCAIDGAGALVGRSILPGVEASLRSLCETSAQLPEVSFEPDCRLLGKGTADAVRSGILYGTVAMAEGMLERYEKAIGPAALVATGDIAGEILPLCRKPYAFRPDLLHEGLYALYRKNERDS